MTEPEAPPRASTKPLDVEDVFRTHFGYVFNTLRRLGVREADLPDLTHDVFVVVHRKSDHYDPTRPLKPWLFGIAANAAADYRRRASHRRERMDDDPEAWDETTPVDEKLAKQERRDLVIEALRSVDESRLPVFVMHEIDGVAMPEVAEALGIPLNTGYSRLRLARDEFKAAVKRLELRRAR